MLSMKKQVPIKMRIVEINGEKKRDERSSQEGVQKTVERRVQIHSYYQKWLDINDDTCYDERNEIDMIEEKQSN